MLLLCSKYQVYRILRTTRRDLISSVMSAFSSEQKSLTQYTPCTELSELPIVACLKTSNPNTTSLSSLSRPLKHIHFDEGYTASVDCTPLRQSTTTTEEEEEEIMEELMAFYNEYGFVVCHGIFDEVECEAARDAMWSILEEANPGMKRDDRSTWESLKSKGRYGLSTRGPSFHPTLVQNRYE